MLAAQHWNGTASSAKVRSPSSCAEPVAQRLRRSAGGCRCARPGVTWRTGPSPYTSRLLGRALPQPDQPVDRRRRRVGGDQGAVERADRGAEDQVRAGRRARTARGACRPRPRRAGRRRRGRTRCVGHRRRLRRRRARRRASVGLRRGTAAVARCSAQKDRNGTVPHSSVTSVNADAPAGPPGEQEGHHAGRPCRCQPCAMPRCWS